MDNAAKAISLLHATFDGAFEFTNPGLFDPQVRDPDDEGDLFPIGTIAWSFDAELVPDGLERLAGWYDTLYRLERRINALGYELQSQDDADFFGGALIPL